MVAMVPSTPVEVYAFILGGTERPIRAFQAIVSFRYEAIVNREAQGESTKYIAYGVAPSDVSTWTHQLTTLSSWKGKDPERNSIVRLLKPRS